MEDIILVLDLELGAEITSPAPDMFNIKRCGGWRGRLDVSRAGSE